MPGSSRAETIGALARSLDAAAAGRSALVAVDGVGASGKTTLADELAAAVRTRPVTVLHADAFFHPPEVRHARGRYSAEGFWLDAYDYQRMVSAAREPLRVPARRVDPGTLVLVEGTFLHRQELVGHWDLSVFLDVPLAEARRRMHARAGVQIDERLVTRWLDAQRIYFRAAQPWQRATVVLDNSEPDRLRVVDAADSAAARDDARGR
jgi:uridine kinase